MRLTLLMVGVLACASFSVAAKGASHPIKKKVPLAARWAGYFNHTFASRFAPVQIDTAKSYASGKQWYFTNFFGLPSADVSTVLFNKDGSVTITGQKSGAGGNGQLTTTGINRSSWVGLAFGCGGYFEAIAKFDNRLVDTAEGWPAFWSMAIEHMADSSGPQWRGRERGYAHFIEADFFEYDIAPPYGNYGGTMHDWQGKYDETCPGFCNIVSPHVRSAGLDTLWTEYHKLGFLWIPATASSPGSARYFFDDRQMGFPTTWLQFTTQMEVSTNQAWAFGIIDKQHLGLLIGTGYNQPFTVQSVDVWQPASACNLSR